MPVYNRSLFDPPAPVAVVTLRHPDTQNSVDQVLMLLDSGADVTLVPQTAVLTLSPPQIPDRLYQLAGFSGEQVFSAAVFLELLFAGRTFRGQFLVIDQEWGIIGRNVLNSLPLLLDGPNLTWNIPSRK